MKEHRSFFFFAWNTTRLLNNAFYGYIFACFWMNFFLEFNLNYNFFEKKITKDLHIYTWYFFPTRARFFLLLCINLLKIFFWFFLFLLIFSCFLSFYFYFFCLMHGFLFAHISGHSFFFSPFFFAWRKYHKWISILKRKYYKLIFVFRNLTCAWNKYYKWIMFPFFMDGRKYMHKFFSFTWLQK